MSKISNLYYESSITHFRTKGSKNGIRLYQNKDGSLTALGRLRYLKNDGSLTRSGEKAFLKQKNKILRKEKGEQRRIAEESLRVKEKQRTADAAAKLREQKAQLEETNKKFKKEEPSKANARPRPKPISEMTDEEITKAIERIKLEQDYKKLITPPKKEKYASTLAKNIAKSVGDNAVKAIGDVAKSQFTNILNDKIEQNYHKKTGRYIGTQLAVKREQAKANQSKNEADQIANKAAKKIYNYGEIAKKAIADISDDDLKAATTRMTNEANYRTAYEKMYGSQPPKATSAKPATPSAPSKNNNANGGYDWPGAHKKDKKKKKKRK